MIEPATTAHMLDTVETLHYAEKFRGQEFLVIFESQKDRKELNLDLLSLHSA